MVKDYLSLLRYWSNCCKKGAAGLNSNRATFAPYGGLFMSPRSKRGKDMQIRTAILIAIAVLAFGGSALAGDDGMEGARNFYAARLERAMLQVGMSADVVAEQTKKANGTPWGKFPKLVVFSYLSKALVFNLITEAKVLDGAKEAGFQTVIFLDRGNDGLWLFDLSKPGSCARGLCWN